MKTKSNKLRTTFAVIYTDVMRSPAWAAMKPAYRALLVEMKAFYNRETKAAVPMSVRYAAKLLGVDKELAADCLEALSHYGFIREVRRGYLGANGVGIATEWRLTDEKYLRRSATLDFLRWDGVLYEPNSRKKQNPVRKFQTGLSGFSANPVRKFQTGSTKTPINRTLSLSGKSRHI